MLEPCKDLQNMSSLRNGMKAVEDLSTYAKVFLMYLMAQSWWGINLCWTTANSATWLVDFKRNLSLINWLHGHMNWHKRNAEKLVLMNKNSSAEENINFGLIFRPFATTRSNSQIYASIWHVIPTLDHLAFRLFNLKKNAYLSLDC